MTPTLHADPLPLRMDEHGSIRVGNTRVLLELLIRAYQQGLTPAELTRRFETLDLADVYAVLAYYERHRAQVDEYMRRREAEAAEIRRKIEAAAPTAAVARRTNATMAGAPRAVIVMNPKKPSTLAMQLEGLASYGQGLASGMRRAAVILLEKRFAPVPRATLDRLEAMDYYDLDELIPAILEAKSLCDLNLPEA